MSDGLVQILDGNTFVVSDERGDIEASRTDPTGLFSFDTRFLSRWVLTVNGERLNALSTDDLQYFQARFFLVPGTGTVYVDSKLSVIRTRAVGDGFHEELLVINHDEQPVELEIRIDADCDFADLFEVKDALQKKGSYGRQVTDGVLHLTYERETFQRETTISASEPREIDERGFLFSVDLGPKARWSTDARRGHGATPGWASACGSPSTAGVPRAPGRTWRRTWTPGSPPHRPCTATGSRWSRPTGAAWSTWPRFASRRRLRPAAACRRPACPGS